MNVRTRIERLESTRPRQSRLVLIAPHGLLTKAQQDQHDAAERAGLDPFVIAIMPRHAPSAGAPA